jgi:2-iminobutanoate/2-iminopropanoate deaminase
VVRIVSISADNVAPFSLDGKAVHGSQAVLADCGEVSMLYTSGQVAPSGPDGRGDITTQVHAVLTQLRELLHAAGAEMSDVVKLMAWARTREDVAAYAAIRREYFTHSPASTSVLSELVEADILIEVEAIAITHPAGQPDQNRAGP